jgi:hypothetical protein
LLIILLTWTLFATDDEGAGTSHRQGVSTFDLMGVVAEEDKVLLGCLENVSFCGGFVFELGDYYLGLWC